MEIDTEELQLILHDKGVHAFRRSEMILKSIAGGCWQLGLYDFGFYSSIILLMKIQLQRLEWFSKIEKHRQSQ